ncbi:neurogenic locus notch homolog protein 3-like [Actinia tenebrosa]|nr:neurogenic locus notch homolog protein 3-like [Actinia tenebrosa]
MPIRTRTRIARHVTLHGATALSLPTSKIFQNFFPDEYSISVTFRPVQYTDIYLLALYDFANKLQFGLRLASGFLTFELAKSTDSAHRQWSLDFDVEISLNRWHSATFSLQAKQLTMYWDCQKVGVKSLPGRFSFAPDHSGTIHLGKPFHDYDRGQKNIEIDELYFIPDVQAAKQQCYNPSFSSKMNRRNIAGSGYYPGEHEIGGSGMSNDIDEVETEWSSWSPCSRTCGNGVRRRVMMCVNLDDSPPRKECLQALQTDEEKPCSLQDCPGHCSQPCLNGGFCTTQNKCRCKAGYHGATCDKVNCNVKCYNGGRCVGPDTCKCKTGYTGKQCQQPICSSSCQNGGSCVRPNVCKCQPGYLPPNCRAACLPACINGGKCVGLNTCLCSRGFKGKHCEKPYCSRPCLNGGNCYAPNACSCPYGWYGSRCEKARCLRKCQNGGKCVRPNMCICPRGAKGYYCQSKVKY